MRCVFNLVDSVVDAFLDRYMDVYRDTTSILHRYGCALFLLLESLSCMRLGCSKYAFEVS